MFTIISFFFKVSGDRKREELDGPAPDFCFALRFSSNGKFKKNPKKKPLNFHQCCNSDNKLYFFEDDRFLKGEFPLLLWVEEESVPATERQLQRKTRC